MLHASVLGHGRQSGLAACKARQHCAGISRPICGEGVLGERLDRHERLRHVIRSLGQWHEQWLFCGASAAVMHGLECSYRQLYPIHVAVDRCRRSKNQTNVRYHVLNDPDAVVVDGVHVTSVQRTLVDCAAMMPFRYALAPIDSALRQGRTTIESLLAYVDALPMLRDRERIRSVIVKGNGGSENGGESECRAG